MLKGLWGGWARKFCKAKRKNEKEITYTIPYCRPVEVVGSHLDGISTTESPVEEAVRMRRLDLMMEMDFGTYGASLTREKVEELLLDQRILIEMRLRIVKLEIIQHVTSEFTKLREFIATLVPPSGPIPTAAVTDVVTEAVVLGSLPQDIYGGQMEPCPNEQDMPVPTGAKHLLNGAVFAMCLVWRNVEKLRENTSWTTPCVCHALYEEGGLALAAPAIGLPSFIHPRTSFLICESVV
ncbi:cell number regulator 6-like [Olea europaea subsp. europaea]|uniref:Cell number regulator 6-like n=1 Tax=Olea europaea subsp. europaea TaxID=158383 RepID=A0A8S0R944_OLEEU|nr:cell number regulator 6-like [Olea europaea subsp. europaea]